MKLLIISGLSGSGKSIALQALEDLDYYCVDNLPLALLPIFTEKLHDGSGILAGYKNAAVGIDARNNSSELINCSEIIEKMRSKGFDVEVIFLESDNQTILKRFSETRRKHPLTQNNKSLAEAIAEERKLLKAISTNADLHIDTSQTNIHQLRALIRERICERVNLSLMFVSFGFKHGAPADADFVFDVRCLPNPYWDVKLRPFTGLDKGVEDFLSSHQPVNDMCQSLQQFFSEWISHFEAENRSYVTVAIGCTGGRHRSVYLVNQLGKYFKSVRENVNIRHRDLT